jgi:hypothetical protein
MASIAHYPAAAVVGQSRTGLLCRDCNALLGSAYEGDAKLFLSGKHAISFGPSDGGRIHGVADVRTDAGKLSIRLDGNTKDSAKVRETLAAIQKRSQQPYALTFQLSRPGDELTRRAMLSWGFLEWVYYAGYQYAAAPGTTAVRRLLLSPDDPSPAAIYAGRGKLPDPMGPPEPVLVVLAKHFPMNSLEDIDEFLGLGAMWGTAGASVLPFGNQSAGEVWSRLEALSEKKRRHLNFLSLRKMFKEIPSVSKGLRNLVEITDSTSTYQVNPPLSEADLAALVQGEHDSRIDPPSQKKRGVRHVAP